MKKEITLATINGQKIQVIENGQKLVPIKPICEVLGIDRKAQQDKIKEDEILSSVGVLSTLTGADGKQYEMFCIPLKYVFGWLFSINPKNVNPEAADAVKQYKEKCYDVLYDYFAHKIDILEQKEQSIKHKTLSYLQKVDEAAELKRNSDSLYKEAKKEKEQLIEALKSDFGQLTLSI